MVSIMSKKDKYLLLVLNTLFIFLCAFIKISLIYGFGFSILLTMITMIKSGFKLNSLINMGYTGLKECSTVIFIILIIGAVISIWMASGILPTMIYYGLKAINGTNYILACFLIATLTSIVMGTPLGAISTVGIALLGIGRSALLPEAILVGAIVSGSFVGDKISPVSGLMNLTMKTTNVTYKECLKPVLKTSVPIIAICSIIYYLLGNNYIANIDPAIIDIYQENINNSFDISLGLMLLPITVIILSILGVNIVYNLSLVLIIGGIISIFFQKMNFLYLIKSIFLGYKGTTGMEGLDTILSGGGILSMLEIVFIIVGAVILSSFLEGGNIINSAIEGFMEKINSKKELITRTTLLSTVLTIITTDQTVGIVLIGKLLQKRFNEMNIENVILTRTIIDTGVSIAPLIPWNVTAIIIAAVTGVSVAEYGLYTVLCYISPIVTILFAYLSVDNKLFIKQKS